MRRTTMLTFTRIFALGAALLCAAWLSMALPGTVLAEEPPELNEPVTDLAGVLDGGERSEAEDGIQRLEDEANVQMFAVFVNDTEGMAAPEYATETARLNGLGGNDVVLVVSFEPRRYGIWVGDALTDVSDDEIDTLLVEHVEPALREEDFGGAVAAGADYLNAAAESGAPAEPQEPGGGGGTPAPDDGDGPPWGAILGIGLLVVGGVVMWRWWQGRQAAGRDEEERDRRLGKLTREANALLIETDELIRHDAQELGFAEAQFGEEAAATFAKALDAAREELRAAFTVRQRLDDNVPEAPQEREQLLNEIVTRCTRAQELLEEQTRRFEELRDLERRAPELLAGTEAAATRLEGRIAEAEHSIGQLRAEAPSAAAVVEGHPAEARKRIGLAREAARQGTDALAADDRSAAGRAARAAQEAIAQATTLLDAVDRERKGLATAQAELSQALAQARTDVQAAVRAVSADGELARVATEARETLDRADRLASGPDRDVVLAHRLAIEAEAAADRVVATVREGEERRAKEVAGARAQLRSAEQSLRRAEDYVQARRHGIGRRPRTRLSEAREAFAAARGLVDSDPAA
ncbi:MAG TPA: TPM domain-containing protein, partial [Candidatus Limnocylindria bacterium]|nr:TPM domain-containing protein [Candidatus Limnocylindria bacterium]